MDFGIETDETGARMTFQATVPGNLFNNLYLSLMVDKGSFFQNPEFGSRLHLLRRAKNTPRTEALAVEYIKEATRWLIDAGRARAITVATERDAREDPNRLKCSVEAIAADGESVTFSIFVEVV